MVRSIVSKVMSVGRATVFMVGLAVIVALVFGVASMAFANGANFILGVLTNSATATTGLNGDVAGGPALQVVNNNTAAGSKGLQLNVATSKPPIQVNATAGKAANLNADKVDGVSLACPSGTLFHEGVCIERTLRGSNIRFFAAEADCLDEPGTRLPTPAELQTLEGRQALEWSNHAYTDSSGTSTIDRVIAVEADGRMFGASEGGFSHYRCVKLPR
jgi:hypothetical protein